MNSDGRSIRDNNAISTTAANAQITTMGLIRTQIENEAKDDPGASAHWNKMFNIRIRGQTWIQSV